VENTNLSYLLNGLKDFLVEAGFSSSIVQVPEINSPTNVMATVGITGEKIGFLTISMNLDNAVTVSKYFAQLMEIPIESDDFSDIHLEALSELSNQVAGRVVMFMEDKKINCSITPPTVMTGDDISMNVSPLNITNFYIVEGEYGFFHITIGLK
jgi:chemotaxis protein CheX